MRDFNDFTKLWISYVTKKTPMSSIPNQDWEEFFFRDNPVAGIDRGEMKDEDTIAHKGKTVLNERLSFKTNWDATIRPGLETILIISDEIILRKQLKDFHRKIVEIIKKGGGRDRTVAVNRVLITFFPDRLITIPQKDLSELIDLLNTSLHISIIDNKDWIDNSISIKSVLDKYYPQKSHWEVYQSLKNQKRINDIFMKDIELLLEKNHNLILTGAPGTGKTYLAREIAAEMIGCKKDDLNDSDQFGFVQFHPSYDYTDFVEGLRPMLSGGFQRTDGTFKAFCAKAAIAETKDAEKVKKQEIKEEDKRKYVFVIDEINRGEISKIFGELFFSIDPGYRKPEDRVRVKTQYQNLIRKGEKIKDDAGNDTADDYLFTEGFYVPSNVYIIGTMNDIDRSVESMDFAFRRRFAFYEILAKDRQEDILSKLSNKDEAIKKMTNLNAAIEKQEGFGPSYHIGPAYFKQIEKYNGDWEQLWKNHLYGVLFEYLRGVPDYKTILNEWKVEFDK